MQKKIQSVLFVCIIAGAFIVLSSFPFAGNDVTQASTEISGDAWVCPIDPDLPKDVCERVMANDPGYLTEEESKANFGPEPSGEGILAVNSCSYSAGTRSVTCEGSSAANTIYVGQASNGSMMFCIQNVSWWLYTPGDVDYFTIWGYDGGDTIDVRATQVNCRNAFGYNYTVYPYNFNNWPSYLVARGGNGSDTIKGTNKADYLYGEGDNDTIEAREGNDYIYGGSNTTGYDSINCGKGLDRAWGGPGEDIFYCSDGSENMKYLYGESESDVYYAPPGGSYMEDLAIGAWYDDGNVFNGNSGVDTMYGDYGPDTMWGLDGVDYIWGLAGADTIHGGRGNDILHGGDDGDEIWGEGHNDQIFGEGGLDCLYGDWNSPTNIGDEGEDTIDAGPDHANCVYCDTVYVDPISGICDPGSAPEPPENQDTAIGCGTTYCSTSGGCLNAPPSYCEIIL